MSFHKFLRVVAVLLIITALGIFTPLGYFWAHSRLAVAAAPSTVPVQRVVLPKKSSVITGHPTNIQIPSLHMNLQVIDGLYNAQTGGWTLTLDKAQFATPSVQPNNLEGNTLIYGHYRPEVFAYLHLIQPGAKVIITTNNGYVFSYTFQTSKAFDPTDTSIFAYKGAPRLTIQTCSGSFMQHRQMYYFSYDGYKEL